MELNCKHNRKTSITKLRPRSAAGKDSLALHATNLYKSRASWKYNNSVVPNLFWCIPPFAHFGAFHSSPVQVRLLESINYNRNNGLCWRQ